MKKPSSPSQVRPASPVSQSPAMFRHDTFATPAGDFSIAVDARGAIAAAAFGDETALRRCLDRRPKKGPYGMERDPAALKKLRLQVEEYFAGSRKPFVFELATEPTPFQDKVWNALKEIPHGETRSYGQLAATVGNPKASRAVGRANGSNPVCLFVPCHRVIGADGSLTGYAYGEDVKRKLLEVENPSSRHY